MVYIIFSCFAHSLWPACVAGCGLIYNMSSFWPNNIVRRFVIKPLVSTISSIKSRKYFLFTISTVWFVFFFFCCIFIFFHLFNSFFSLLFFLVQHNNEKSGHIIHWCFSMELNSIWKMI